MSERVVILFGGSSDERKVSVASAQHLAELLPEAELWFESREGQVYRCPRAALAGHQQAFTTELPAPGPVAWPSLAAALDQPDARAATYLLGYHGGAGEDGTVQRLLEARGLAFTGSGSAASATAFNKDQAKAAARRAGVRTVESIDLPAGEAPARAALAGLLAKHGRLVAKPISGGSSVGLHHLRAEADLDAAAQAIAASGLPYMAEAFVSGRELTVGVVDGPNGPRALPPSEVRMDPGRAFDYEGKYLAKGTTEITPAQVPPDVYAAAQALAVAAHRAMGCLGYSRTDMILGPEGPVFLETNTLPGLTKASFLPQQLAAEGTPVRTFIEGQLALARARAGR